MRRLSGGSSIEKTILVADDDAGVRAAISNFLEAHGYIASQARTCSEVLDVLSCRIPDAAILDFRLPDGDAIQILERIRDLDVQFPIVVLTGYGSIELAVQAVQKGASNFLTKPLNLSRLLIELQRLIQELPAPGQPGIDPFAGTSHAIRTLAAKARRVVASSRPVLLLGETGSGKGTLARWIHAQSPRAKAPLISLNCAALSPGLLESELFGHQRGAFSGAISDKPGLIEAADGGTLLLDEIGDMAPAIQPKLLTVLEDQQFHRLGSVTERKVDIRLIAATHQDLLDLSARRQFRCDLYFRISTLPLHVPALRDRREDLPVLIEQMLAALARELAEPELRVTGSAMAVLQEHTWPGNIRELRNVLERAVLLGQRPVISERELHFDRGDAIAAETPSSADERTLAEVERAHIEHMLTVHGGSVSKAAEALGIPRSTLYARLRRYTDRD